MNLLNDNKLSETLIDSNNHNRHRHQQPKQPRQSNVTLTIPYWLAIVNLIQFGLIAPIDTATVVVRPFGGAATLVPGQPLHFECGQTGQSDPQFVW